MSEPDEPKFEEDIMLPIFEPAKGNGADGPRLYLIGFAITFVACIVFGQVFFKGDAQTIWWTFIWPISAIFGFFLPLIVIGTKPKND